MFRKSGEFVGSRFFSFLSLLIILCSTSGCATRALMSSDRYEKTAPESKQLRSNDTISQSIPPEMMEVEQAFADALRQQNSHNQSI